MKEAWAAAKATEKVHGPCWLKNRWMTREREMKKEGIAELIAMIRNAMATPQMDDPKKAPLYVTKLVRLIVEQFERLVLGGALDETLPKLNALPLLFSPTAGNRASKWEWAVELFKRKRVGADAPLVHRSQDTDQTRAAEWRLIAKEAVIAARYTAASLPRLDRLRAKAVAYYRFDFRRERASYGVVGIFYLLDDGGVLLWPDWLDRCRDLRVPGGVVHVAGNVRAYKTVVEMMAKEFFGDPKNSPAEELCAALARAPQVIARGLPASDRYTMGTARAVAVKNVVEAVGRLGGEKR